MVNTIGKEGKLGAHIRCVVSVSMLTEGWDANTVTHIMGLRAFGSQLLCEQVAGRALRRMNYYLQGYDSEGNPTDDKRKIKTYKFPPEYAHIIGVPFKLFKGGQTAPPPPPVDMKHIKALSERQKEMEIVFPNVTGYRLENYSGEIQYDFSGVENYELVCSHFPHTTLMTSAFLPKQEKMQVQSVFEKREQEICFLITKELIKLHFSDDEHNAQFQLFNKLLKIVRYWYDNKVILVGESDLKYKKLLFFDDIRTMVNHIRMGINPHLNNVEHVRPVFNYYNRFGSSKYVNGNTVKEVFITHKSHVNRVAMDSEWEGIAAKTLEELDQVECYVKNKFMGFAIPYLKDGKDRQYFTDFIARVKCKDGTVKMLMIEISGFNKDKSEKKCYVENRWLPAVNALKDKYEYPEWHFIEIAIDIKDVKNQLINKTINL